MSNGEPWDEEFVVAEAADAAIGDRVLGLPVVWCHCVPVGVVFGSFGSGPVCTWPECPCGDLPDPQE